MFEMVIFVSLKSLAWTLARKSSKSSNKFKATRGTIEIRSLGSCPFTQKVALGFNPNEYG